MADTAGARTLFTDPVAESGAGTALFEIFKQNQELEQYAKKKDVDTSAAMKLRTQENEFATGLATLHSKYRMAEADAASNRAMQDLTIKGTALGQMVSGQAKQLSEQTGQGIPGLTYQGAPETPNQSTGEEAMPWQTSPVNPLAATESAKVFESAFSSELRKREAKSQISYQSERDMLRDKLGLITDSHAKAATSLKAQLEAIDPTNANIPLLDAFLEPGQAHQADFSRTVPQIAMQVEKAKAALNLAKAMESSRLERMKQVTSMQIQSRELIAKLNREGKQDNQSMLQLRRVQTGFSAHYQTLRNDADRLSQQLNAGMLSGPGEMQARAQLAQTEQAIQTVQASIDSVNQAMIAQMTKVQPTGPSNTEQANIRKRIGTTVLKERGIKFDLNDIPNLTKEQEKQLQKLMPEIDRRVQEYMKKQTQSYNPSE